MTYILVSKNREDLKALLLEKIKELLRVEINSENIPSNPDIHILDKPQDNSIGIEDIKDFIKKMRYKPFQEITQLAIIIDSQKMTTQAQNSLLKTLEDSSKYATYILCVDNAKNLLPTVISRAQVIYVKNKSKHSKEFEVGENLLELDLYNQFLLIEKYSEDKDSSLDFISKIEQSIAVELELEIKNGNIESSKRQNDNLKLLQRGREKILANCNRRVVLESILLELALNK